MSEHILVDNRSFKYYTPFIDGSGVVSLDSNVVIDSAAVGNQDHPSNGRRRLVKTHGHYFAFYDHGPGYGVETWSDSSWRRIDILKLDPARDIYKDMLPSADSVFELQYFLPIHYNMDSLHSPFDSTQGIPNDSELRIAFNAVLDRVVSDSADIELDYYTTYNTAAGFKPADDSFITSDSYNVFYDGATYTAYPRYRSFSLRESSGDLVAQFEDDFNIYQSFIDSTQGINVIYYNTSRLRWEHRVVSDDSAIENWDDGSTFLDSGTTEISVTNDSAEREYGVPASRLGLHLQDAMGIYHAPTFEFRAALDSFIGAGNIWMGKLDSLGEPWSTEWKYPERGFDWAWDAPKQADQNVYENDSYSPLPLAIIQLDSV